MKVSGVAVSKSFLLRLLATNLPLLLLIHWFLIHYRIFLFKALQNVLPKVLKLHSKLGGGGGGGRGGVGQVVQRCWVNFQCRDVLPIWIRVEQGPTVFAAGAGGVVWTFFSHLSFLFSFYLRDGPM